MAASPKIGFREIPIDGGPVEFPDGATHWKEIEIDRESGVVLVSFEFHDQTDDTDERGGFA